MWETFVATNRTIRQHRSLTMMGFKAVQRSLSTRRSFSIVSRRAVQRLQAARDAKTKRPSKRPAEDEKPWPRSFVLGFCGVVSIAVPYTVAWYLAQHGPLREKLLFDGLGLADDHAVLQWMRRTFGAVDWAEHPDHHSGLHHHDPHTTQQVMRYKFDDEPTYAVRMEQAQVEARNAKSIQVLVFSLEHQESSEELTELPAVTPANFGSFGGPVALEFPDENDTTTPEYESADTTEMVLSLTEETNRLPLSVYSLWHYHVPQEPLQRKSEPATRNNSVRLELDRIAEQIQAIELSVQNGQSIDEVQSELNRLRSEQRRLQFRQYFW